MLNLEIPAAALSDCFTQLKICTQMVFVILETISAHQIIPYQASSMNEEMVRRKQSIFALIIEYFLK